MAKRGPMPARSEERRRVNQPKGTFTKADDVVLDKNGVNTRPTPPEPKEDWDERALALYDSLRTSPGVIFMYDADWQTAWALVDQYDANIKPQFVGFEETWNSEAAQMEQRAVRERLPIKGATLQSLFTQLQRIALVGEDTRRRMQFEAPMLDLSGNDGVDLGAEDDGVVRDINEARRIGLAGA